MNTEKTRDEMLKKHFDRWQQLGRLTGPTNEAMAETALQDLFRLMKQQPPKQIAWLDSPLQMAAVPIMVGNIVQSETWKAIYQRMAADPPGTEEWDRNWKRQWKILENGEVHDLLTPVLRREDFLNVTEDLVQSTVAALHNTLRKALLIGALQPGSMKYNYRLVKPPEGVPGWVPINLTPFKHLDQIGKDLHTRARVKQPSPLRDALEELLKDVSLVKSLSNLMPQAAPHPDPEKQAILNLIQDRSRGTFVLFERRSNYMVTLPARKPDPLPVAPELTDTDRLKNFTAASGFVFGSVQEGWKRSINRTQIPFTIWLPAFALYIPFAMACQKVYPGLFGELTEHIDTWSLLCHAAAGYTFSNDIVFACRRPLSCSLDGSDRVHNEDGPAMVWRDGYEVYAWKGINVDKHLIMNKRTLTIAEILAEPNAEIRRTMVEIYGESAYLMHSGAKLIHSDEYGRLYELKHANGDAMQMVRVTNSTPEPDGTFKEYFLSVPPTMTRARQAVAWTFGMAEHEYCPMVQT